MKKILVVEDDPTINQVICEFLKAQGYEAHAVFDGQLALDFFKQNNLDLIILDIMIPSISGIDVLKEIRKTSSVPILMLTALDDEYTQLTSFNQLISDYVTKPFSPLILMKRVENILRQNESPKESLISIDNLRIYPEQGIVYDQDNQLELTRKEYDILLLLAQNRGYVLTRDFIMESIWGYTELDSRVLDNHVRNLRKKIPHLKLKTVIGRGYQLEV
ncbi:response regulator transcription factor [Streptococcus moroccensis]|uniref:DNA-binding response OmpR family regulator n=1 Tax=Streptococcus moroccensis TaxID=1451356 RepID=A0ABT9YV99_9STRE|nr:response regulator transcription factor [Streptococcus moroccensis]MDQ0223521.1 DNA-binding response OmpR family regulator [Streptococcus moroccensis]